MTDMNLIARLSCAVLIGLFVLPAPSDARPKKIVSNGCTMDQIQSNFGNSCVNQMEQDIMGNKPYTHALLCSGGQMLCCTYDNTTNQIQTCRKPAGSGLMTGAIGSVGISGTAGIQRRGVDASTEAAEEEAPAPEWMTPERMQQLQKDIKETAQ
ncbi:MAG: hypothetical protein ABS70_00320 [Nitrospira sp. SCN 59-13]|nr:MAG: hypothetical protein ABS70_00320 [Nitrospira sp. SCN 59-13]